MTRLRYLVCILVLTATGARAQTSADLTIEIGGTVRMLRASELAALPLDTVRARAHDGPEQIFVGPRLLSVLTRAGAHLDSLRGRALGQYVLVEARDKYRIVLAVAEISPDFTARRVILAREADGQAMGDDQGPWRLVVEGELRPARWVRQVDAIRLRSAPE